MGDYFIRYGDGDLESVVRGGGGGYHPPSSYCNAPVPFGSLIQEDIGFDFSSIPEFFETEIVFDDELEALYKPFYPTNINPLSPQSSTISSTTFGFEQRSDHSENKVQEKETSSCSGSPVVDATHHQVKYKRRKNQQKRVVMQVKEEDLSSDKWAWRKYGQKPIKGSPYPRSYYRCSSSKGCLARKQVERSLSDPETFIITYTAEHCHGHPTRRNSLAGTTRNKYSITAPKSPGTTIDHNPNTSSTPKSCSYSPMEDELMLQEEIKMERIEGEANVQEMGEMLLRDDFIVKFDEMDMVNYGVDYSRSDMWFGIN